MTRGMKCLHFQLTPARVLQSCNILILPFFTLSSISQFDHKHVVETELMGCLQNRCFQGMLIIHLKQRTTFPKGHKLQVTKYKVRKNALSYIPQSRQNHGTCCLPVIY